MPRMKPQTIILSLLLSRWKHIVTTSSSLASLQKSIPWFRQNDLVHSEHEVDRDRGDTLLLRDWVSSSSLPRTSESASSGPADNGAAKRERESEEKKRERRACEEESDCGCWLLGPRGMMVLFLKHVHLQKTGASRMD